MATATAKSIKPAGKGSSPIRPLGDRVVVQPITERAEQTAGGLYLPESAQEKPQLAKVIAVGPGKRDEDGNYIPIPVQVGQQVFHSRYGGTTVKIGTIEYVICREDDILGVFEG